MPDYGRKIIYLSDMESGNKIKNAGFIRVETCDDRLQLDMHVSGMTGMTDQYYPVLAEYSAGQVNSVGRIFLRGGKGDWKETFHTENMENIYIELSDSRKILGSFMVCSKPELKAGSLEKAVNTEKEKLPAEKGLAAGECINRDEAEIKKGKLPAEEGVDQIILSDKWQQLRRIYPVVHPYGDEREYISIQPRDFVIMTGDYQHLANNSFLLHGFYNYRYLVLGREKEYFYLGVPGVYYEREKMVALMFGFEAFECTGGKAEAGTFGYYLRRVCI